MRFPRAIPEGRLSQALLSLRILCALGCVPVSCALCPTRVAGAERRLRSLFLFR